MLASWLAEFFRVLCPTILVVSLPFCGPNRTDHFFCDSWPLLRLSCRDTYLLEVVAFLLSSLVLLGSLALTSVSYAFILATVLRDPQLPRKEENSPPVPHTLQWWSSFSTSVCQRLNLCCLTKVSVLNCIITPLLNKFIFSLCNDKVKQVLRDALRWHWSIASRKLCGSQVKGNIPITLRH